MSQQNIINLHVGEAGNRLGCSLWSLFVKEHGMEADGSIPEDITVGNDDTRFTTFFKENSRNRWSPRAIFIDSDKRSLSQVINELKSCVRLSSPIVGGIDDAGNLFSRGYHKVGSEMIESVIEAVRHEAECSSNIQGFIAYYSLGGGTGSGFTSLIREIIGEMYPNRLMFECGVSPSSRLSSSTVEPYNAALAISNNLSSSNCTFLVESDALQDIAVKKVGIKSPSLSDINKVASRVISSVTAGLRFESKINPRLIEMDKNLVPFPKVHFPLVSYSPFGYSCCEPPTVRQITSECIRPDSRVLKFRGGPESSLGFCLVYRGDVKTSDIKEGVTIIRDTKPWSGVDWSPIVSKAGLCTKVPVSSYPGAIFPRAVCLMNNSSAISKLFCSISRKFDMMYSKRCFLHWYMADGLEESDLATARESLAHAQLDYEAIATPGGLRRFRKVIIPTKLH